MATLKMVVGLGNPGPKYAFNRHNIGFQALERFARSHSLLLDKMQTRALIGQGWVQNGELRQKILLAKPLTYMNASGEAVAALARFYQVEPIDMLVIHDDLDLASGRLRLRPGGGWGGQNGVKPIIQQLGPQDFARLRVGIGRPPGRMDAADYVLQDFSKDEEEVFGPLRERICDAIESWLFEGIVAAMNKYNL